MVMTCLHLLCLPFMPQSLLGVMFFARIGVKVTDVQRWR
ncbi:putative membrane protein [Synechococcus sp. ROS8604]|nr:putative membrane protein [Synechococcus sp. ROS8604]